MAIKRTAADIAFSNAIREGSDFTCQNEGQVEGLEPCGVNLRHSPQTMDCSHVFSRKHRNTRWHPLNALCLCRSCHSKVSDRPLIHAEFVKAIKGEDNYWRVMRLHNQVLKLPKSAEKDIAKHYRSELKRIESKRNAGHTGYIEVKNWMVGQ